MAGSAWTNQVQNQVVVGGTNGRVLVYSGTPALNNLIASIAGANGTDSFGNAYLRGIVSYHEISFGSLVALQDDATVLTWFTATSAAGPWSQGATITGPGQIVAVNGSASTQFNTTDVPTNGGFEVVNTGLATFNGMLFSPSTGLVALVGGVQEPWHTMAGFGAGFSAGTPAAAFKLYPDNTVALAGEVSVTSGTTSGTIVTLGAAYRPVGTHKFAVPFSAGTPAATANCQITVDSSGHVILSAGPTGAAYNIALEGCRFPLDY